MFVKTCLSMVTFFAACSYPAAPGAEVWHVDSCVAEWGRRETWGTASQTIEEGLCASSDGDTLIVAPRTYVDNIEFNGMNMTLTGIGLLGSNVTANAIVERNELGSVFYNQALNTARIRAELDLHCGADGRPAKAHHADNSALNVTVSEMPDLIPTALTAPASAVSDHQIEVSWTVENQGAGEAKGPWYDRIYFSTDGVWDGQDTILSSFFGLKR